MAAMIRLISRPAFPPFFLNTLVAGVMIQFWHKGWEQGDCGDTGEFCIYLKHWNTNSPTVNLTLK